MVCRIQSTCFILKSCWIKTTFQHVMHTQNISQSSNPRHAWCHLVLDLKTGENPRSHKTLSEEDMLGKITKLASAVHGGTVIQLFLTGFGCFWPFTGNISTISHKRSSRRVSDGNQKVSFRWSPKPMFHIKKPFGGNPTLPISCWAILRQIKPVAMQNRRCRIEFVGTQT